MALGTALGLSGLAATAANALPAVAGGVAGLAGGSGGDQTTQRILDPAFGRQLGNQEQQLGLLQALGQRLSGQIQRPELNTQFAGPQFSQSLDPFSQRLVSQGQQQLAQGAGRARQEAGQAFRGQGALGQILGQQAASQARLQANPLLFQAAQQQRGRESEQFSLNQQAQALSNQALLQQAQAGNQGLQQQFGFAQAPMQQRSDLLRLLTGASGSRSNVPLSGQAIGQGIGGILGQLQPQKQV